jgi:uncharacterized protein YydD (DUF2326 family)
VFFKPGLNLIVGKKKNPLDTNMRNTYNGVGKSLIIYLIHFCLGSNSIKVFENKIPEWEFMLEFEIDGISYTTTRNTSKQKDVFLNGKKYSVSGFRSEMLKKLFKVQEKLNSRTFNTLFPRFIRRDRECYAKYDMFIKKEQDYSKLLNNAFLLGIDVELINEKKRLRDSQKSSGDLMKSLEKDPVIKEHFDNQKDSEIEILDLDEEIIHFESEIQNFKVAANYHEIEVEANEVSYDLKKLENNRFIISNSIINIEKSLKIEPDVSNATVVKLYQQAKIEIPEMIKQRVEEVLIFHQSMLSKRKERLFGELKTNREKLKSMNDDIENKGNKLDELLGYLNTHGALDEYVSINKKLGDIKLKRKRLEEHQNIIKTYKKKLREIKADYAIENQQAEEYLDSIQELLENIMTTFRELSKSFYDKSGGIKITNNDGENTLRFNITAKIQDDSSDGVNEVKIFCFDMTLLLLQLNHKVKFIFHDSRLFSNMDPRQRYTLFKLAYNKSKENDLQYIASVNEDTMESFREIMGDGEFQEIIENNVILTLTDESEKSKLLGIQIDMDYEK